VSSVLSQLSHEQASEKRGFDYVPESLLASPCGGEEDDDDDDELPELPWKKVFPSAVAIPDVAGKNHVQAATKAVAAKATKHVRATR
jgi:hypothetical protein